MKPHRKNPDEVREQVIKDYSEALAKLTRKLMLPKARPKNKSTSRRSPPPILPRI